MQLPEDEDVYREEVDRQTGKIRFVLDHKAVTIVERSPEKAEK
jgi:hypothetical protein